MSIDHQKGEALRHLACRSRKQIGLPLGKIQRATSPVGLQSSRPRATAKDDPLVVQGDPKFLTLHFLSVRICCHLFVAWTIARSISSGSLFNQSSLSNDVRKQAICVSKR
jgi:hypothetical protein